MGPKRDKKGPVGAVEKDKDNVKPVGSDTLLRALTPTVSLPNFVKEFNAICNEEQTTIVPEIVAIKHDNKTVQKKSSEAIPAEVSKESLEQTESVHEVEVKYLIIMMFENPEKYLNLRQIHFKGMYGTEISSGFPMDIPLIKTFGRVINNKLTVSVLRLENCGLTSEGLDLLTGYILETRTITDLNLDSNPIPEQNYYILLENPTMITHLSLRLCDIDDQGAALLAHQLEFSKYPKQVLISLNLNMNCITHLGAQYLGNALRTNRTLMSLSLAGNRLKDEGAILLATPLGKFELTHEEIVERRRRNIERIKAREYLIEHYVKVAKSSTLHVGGKSSATRTGSPLKSKRVSVETNLQRTGSAKEKKKFGSRESKSTTKVLSKSITRVASGTTSSVSVPLHTSSTDALGSKDKEKAAAEHRRIELIVEQQMEIDNHPYSIDVWPEHGALFCRGNQKLAHLNLAYNGIGSKGLKMLYATMQEQEETLLWHEELVRQGVRGVLRLTLQGNPISANCSEIIADLQDLLAPRLERSLNSSILSLGKSNAVTISMKSVGRAGSPISKQGSARLM